MSKPQKNKSISLENTFSKLEEIINKIEEDNIPLDQIINLFEEGILLTKLCEKKIKEAEKKIDRLLDKDRSLE